MIQQPAIGVDDLDIAVVGLGCRFPDASTPAQYWENLCAGRESIRRLTDEELERSGVPASDYNRPSYVKAAGVLDGVEDFDAAFFGYSPREAELIDPQVRVFLECAWEALEDAACDPLGQTQSVGVFAASSINTYLLHHLTPRVDSRRFILSDGNLQQFLGSAADFLATRVSYKLNLKGPSVTLQTACSGALVAVHLARQSLLAGECSMALAGGVSIYLPQSVGYEYREGLILSPDGCCRPFDAEAAGTVFGRGAGVVVLKRLAEAMAAGDRIYAVIKGSAVNNDGSSKVGFTAPSVSGQAEVIAEAIANAGVPADTITYVEAHATATTQGDPIEIAGLTKAFRAGSERTGFCAIGSVKGNIGHLDAAAGIAGLMKAVLALQHRRLPATLHFTRPNPAIDFERSPFFVNAVTSEWKEPAGFPRRAGVSAFGMGGTNAHVVLEEAPSTVTPAVSSAERPVHVLTLSARSAGALTALSERLAARLEHEPLAALADLCFTANVGRAQLPHRLAVVTESPAEALAHLRAAARGQASEGVVQNEVRGARAKVAWLFTGQGSQYPGMARALYETAPAFRTALDRCAASLRSDLPEPLLDVLYGAASTRLESTAYAQPAIFAVEYALAELWRSWGVEPDAVLGHSIGEYVAACVAGVFDLEDALRLVAARGRLMEALPRDGAMAAVLASMDSVVRVIDGTGDVEVAAVNAPDATVITGLTSAVERACAALHEEGIETQRLQVSHAFHSARLEPMLGAFAAVANRVRYAPPRLPVATNVSGRLASARELTAQYWVAQARQPVQFAAGVRALLDAGCDLFLEIGPHSTLSQLARRCAPEGSAWFGASLRRDRDSWRQLLETLGTAWVRGVPVDWVRFDGPYQRRRVALPTYPFQRQRHWVEPVTSASRRIEDAQRWPGRAIESPALRDRVFELEASSASPAYLADHVIGGIPVMPMTAYVALMAAASCRAVETIQIEDLTLYRAMRFPGDARQAVHTVLTPDDGQRWSAQVFSRDAAARGEAGAWVKHAGASVRALQAGVNERPAALDLPAIQDRCTERWSGPDYYAALHPGGLEYGPAFQGIETVWRRPGEALARVRCLPEFVAEEGAIANPAFLDAFVQAVFAAFPVEHPVASLYLPVSVQRAAVCARVASACWSHVTLEGRCDAEAASFTATITVADADGQPVMLLTGVTLQRTSRDALARLPSPSFAECLYESRWQAKPLPSAERSAWTPSPPAEDELERAVDDVRTQYRLDVYDALQPRLDALCTAYAVAAFMRLGWAPAAGDRFTTQSLVATLGIQPRYTRMVGRLLEFLAEDEFVRGTAPDWHVSRVAGDLAPDARARELLQSYPSCRAELTMVQRCGDALADVLAGRRDPLELLFPDGDLADLETLYTSAPFASAYNDLVRRAVSAALADAPAGRRVRLLEIGAGTGGTASWLLPALPPDRVEYVFTDVSPLFLARAKQRFAAYPFVRYGLLDIERDPGEQGFGPRTFDIVLATNAVHTTVDLGRTLEYVRNQLVPSGLLVLVEGVVRQRWIDLIFGLTDGWWRFADAPLRRDYPLIGRSAWRDLLAATGFDATTICPADERPGALFQQAVIVSRRDGADSAQGAVERHRRHWLIVADADQAADALAQRLDAQGDGCTVVRCAATLLDRDDFARVLRDTRPPLDVDAQVVYLRDASGAAEQLTMDADALMATQRTGVGNALYLVQAILDDSRWSTCALTLVTRGAQPVQGVPGSMTDSTLWGFGRSLGLEHPELKGRRIDLDPRVPLDPDVLIDLLTAVDAEEDEVGIRDRTRYVSRFERVDAAVVGEQASASGDCFRLRVGSPGHLDTIALERAARREPDVGEVEIEVVAAGLNFKDVLHAMGVLPGDLNALGFECAGRIARVGRGVERLSAGDEVVVVAAGTFGTHVTVPAAHVLPKPAALSMQDAAASAVVFLTASYGLEDVARLRRGERVLVHSAAGGVGMAALQIARRAGATIFATAGTPEKRAWLHAQGIEHIFDSRSDAFVPAILAVTSGRGIDVALSSAAGDAAAGTWAVLAPGGRFVDLTKTVDQHAARTSCRSADVSYTAIDVYESFAAQPERFAPKLAELLRALERGELTPLPRRTYAAGDAASAFRYMAQGRHQGKIVLGVQPDAGQPVHPDATYLITGGYGGLGLLIANWLVERGASSLALLGRHPPSGEASDVIDSLRRRGVQVLNCVGDVARPDDVARALQEVDRILPPLRGVIHAAGTVDDGMLVHQHWERFAGVMAAKVAGSWNLHQQTMGRQLDFFVMFSTYVSLLGSAGQSNHAAANAFMDGLAARRRADGLPALSINWGPWGEAGAAVRLGLIDTLARHGLQPLAPATALSAFAALLRVGGSERHLPPQVGVLSVDWDAYLPQSAQRDAPRLLPMAAGVRSLPQTASEPSPLPDADIRAAVEAAAVADRPDVLSRFVRDHIARSLGIRTSGSIDVHQPLRELGMDSLLAVEVRSLIGRALGRALPATLLFDYPTVDSISRYLGQEVLQIEPWSDVSVHVVTGGPRSPDDALAAIEQMSDEDVERQLAGKVESAAGRR